MKKSTLKKLSALTRTGILVAMLGGCGQNATEGSSSDATSQSSSGTQESAPYALKIFGTDFWGNTGRYDDIHGKGCRTGQYDHAGNGTGRY